VIIVWIVIALVVVVGLAFLVGYNRFVSQRALIDNSWSNVDTELQRRLRPDPEPGRDGEGLRHPRALDPRIGHRGPQPRRRIHGITGAAGGGRERTGRIAALPLRGERGVPRAEGGRRLHRPAAAADATEDRIQAARRFYNNNVRDYNARVQSVPSNLIARLGGFAVRQYFQIDTAVGQSAPQVDL